MSQHQDYKLLAGIGSCDDLVDWPPRLPNLSCLDYFFWRHVKSLVYDNPSDNAENLVARIRIAAGEVREVTEILEEVRASMYRRCEAHDGN
ncbi:hypothetical protein NPIL_435911 [Nephila pilipes]|uniref:Uncharacterized protein n=1 Tax=Nephila pilipes TaxID=299642 RepID=A0A8X6UHG2_NEPPI|nr:hypothetical protein NPIL_435911 [Nephila pilipes]